LRRKRVCQTSEPVEPSRRRQEQGRCGGLRDAAEAGRLDAVWCLSPDRLARIYAYQVIVLDELARHGVTVLFHDAPPLADDPQAQLLTQVQGVIAEYERAKIAERYRRGKLWRARAGEVIAWKCSYGSHAAPTGPHTSRFMSPRGRSCDASFATMSKIICRCGRSPGSSTRTLFLRQAGSPSGEYPPSDA
jgi:hypothetical protein